METTINLNGAIEQLLYQQSGYWSSAGGAALLFYDWLLCLDREAQYIRKARWTFGKSLFVFHRYAMMALVVALLYTSVTTSSEDTSPEWCRTWEEIGYISTIVISSAIQGTFVLRVCVLYRDSPSIIVVLGTMYAFGHATMLFLFYKVRSSVHYLPNPYRPYHACVRTCDKCIRWTVYMYIPPVVIDTVILVLTVRRSFVTRSQRNAAPIHATLFRDGIIYFVIAFATALVNILFWAFAPWAMKPWMTNYLRPMFSSIATRLLLNLYDQVSQTAHYTDPPTTANGGAGTRLSTVEFAVLPRARDVESDGMGEGLKDESLIGGSTLELKPLGKKDREEWNDGPEEIFDVEGPTAPENVEERSTRPAKATADGE